MARVHCRCRSCGTRQTKPIHPDKYLTAPVCRHCKKQWVVPRNLGKNVQCSPVPAIRVDTWAQGRGWRKHTCHCDGYHHPHRRGSRWCYHNELYGHTKDELGTEHSPIYQHEEDL